MAKRQAKSIATAGRPVILVSACLLGVPCRYDGLSKPSARVKALARRAVLVPVCPEQLAGLPTPRERAEIRGRRVVTAAGQDLTAVFARGAVSTVDIARLVSARRAVLRRKSPSCGCGWVYDGTFSGRLVPGDGVATKALKKAGLEVLTDDDI